jgi:hypothetical protein
MFQGADVDGLEKVGQECEKAADIADTVRKALIAVVAASWVFGPFGGAFTSYLATVVIPWLGRISMALHLFAKVLAGHADAQRRVSAGKTVDFSTLPAYRPQALPEGDTRQYPILPEGPAGSGGAGSGGAGSGGPGGGGGYGAGGSGGGHGEQGGSGGGHGEQGGSGGHGEGPHRPSVERPILGSGMVDRQSLHEQHHEDFAHGGGTRGGGAATSHSGSGSRSSTSGDPGTPCPCANASASATTVPAATTALGGSGPCARSWSWSEPRSWYSMTMHGRPLAVTWVSSTVTMCGRARPRRTVISSSRWKRAIVARPSAPSVSTSSTLTATGRSRPSCRAR